MFPRFFCAAATFPPETPASINLTGEAQRHMVVRRLKPGDTLVLFDGQGREAEGKLTRLEKHRAEILLHDLRTLSRESPLQSTLILSLIANDAMDYALQKCVELGVSTIMPVQAQYSQALPSAAWAGRHGHWQKVILSACAQSGRNTLPILMPMQRLSTTLNTLPSPEANSLHCLAAFSGKTFRQVHAENPRTINALTLAIGPEGGFTETEIQAFMEKSFVPVQLGARVLRAETAAVSMISVAQSLWGDG